MKKNNFVLGLLLISSILCIEKKDYNLTSGYKYQYTFFEKDGVYKFYTNAKFSQNVTFAFHAYITESPLYYIYIYEYSNRDDVIANKEKNLSMMNIEGGYTDSVTFASYIVSSPNTYYIAFEVCPKRQIYNSMAKIDVIDGEYDLSNRESKKINVKSGGIYIFYVQAKEDQKVNINLTTNYVNNNPFSKIEISEYLLRENNFNAKASIKQSITSKTKTSNNELISSFSYTVLPDEYSNLYHNYKVANYIALTIIASNINYLIVQFDVLVYFHNLNYEYYYTLTNLKADTTYSFYTNVNKYQLANFSLEISNITEKPFNFVNIYEYADTSYAYEEKENKTILFSIKENNLITSFSYILKNVYKKTNCIYINIKPLFDINYIKINKEIIGGIFELSSTTSKNLTNLKIGGPYYFSIKTEKFQIITFNVIMNNMNTKPFETVYFYEYDYRGIKESNYIRNEQQKISFSSSNNQLISTFSYIVSEYWNRETALNIIPNSNIKYMNIKIEIENTIMISILKNRQFTI